METVLILDFGAQYSQLIARRAQLVAAALEALFDRAADTDQLSPRSLHSLAIIESAEPGNIVFREEA